MSDDEFIGYADAAQQSGQPDEHDGAALSSAEELDEDRLQVDPLEAGMDPPERWSGVDKYGMTPYEEAHPRPLADRLAEEQPEAEPAPPSEDEPEGGETVEELAGLDPADGVPDDADVEDIALAEAMDRGRLDDEAGGSMAAVQRTPEPPS